ncbi:MAG: DUF3501 family protein [Alphaproteobacteria bacterium]|nr:DUF3501 family protein [Alphaproteobacteria bacterium]
MARAITPADILPAAEYEARRKELRAAHVARKRARRIAAGPYITLFFENRDTMVMQIHEMLRIEKGGAGQIEGELAAYNPLVPMGSELIATMMIEIEDAAHRAVMLARLGHVEDVITLAFSGWTVTAEPVDPETERTTADGKTSAVHFLRFPLAPAQRAGFATPGAQVIVGVAHANYAHLAVMPESMRAALALDLDP